MLHSFSGRVIRVYKPALIWFFMIITCAHCATGLWKLFRLHHYGLALSAAAYLIAFPLLILNDFFLHALRSVAYISLFAAAFCFWITMGFFLNRKVDEFMDRLPSETDSQE